MKEARRWFVYLLLGVVCGRVAQWIHVDLLEIPLAGVTGWVVHFSLFFNIVIPALILYLWLDGRE